MDPPNVGTTRPNPNCRLYIISSGQGSPCLDLRRVSSEVADATVGADLGERVPAWLPAGWPASSTSTCCDLVLEALPLAVCLCQLLVGAQSRH